MKSYIVCWQVFSNKSAAAAGWKKSLTDVASLQAPLYDL